MGAVGRLVAFLAAATGWGWGCGRGCVGGAGGIGGWDMRDPLEVAWGIGVAAPYRGRLWSGCALAMSGL
jgi:hypothetical protein